MNGNTAFHAMGMIKIAPQQTAITSDYLSSEIPRLRLTPKEKAETLKAGDIAIKPCCDPKKSGIDSVRFTPLTMLIESVSSTPLNVNHDDIIWAAGRIVKK